jgi:SAM-dependent methyltransferase
MYREHWDSFYAQPHPDLVDPTPFARHCLHRIAPGSTLFELGCGNGRDALYFARHRLRVTACDQSSVAIGHLREQVRRTHRLHAHVELVEAEFRHLGEIPPVDVVYSRFTLHAVDADEASSVLRWSRRALRPGGQFMIEARSVKGELYGRGEPAGRDAFVHDGHYRRFIRLDELTGELEAVGFEIEEAIEERGLAVFGADDPVVVRVLARAGGASRNARGDPP